MKKPAAWFSMPPVLAVQHNRYVTRLLSLLSYENRRQGSPRRRVRVSISHTYAPFRRHLAITLRIGGLGNLEAQLHPNCLSTVQPGLSTALHYGRTGSVAYWHIGTAVLQCSSVHGQPTSCTRRLQARPTKAQGCSLAPHQLLLIHSYVQARALLTILQ